MKEIKLTQGKVAVVDDCDYEELSKHKWLAQKNGNTFYAERGVRVDGKKTNIKMHRQILGLTKGDGKVIDHVNHNGLDNQRHNLRVCTNTENNCNQQTRSNPKSSKFKGVSRNKGKGKWRAYIKVNQKNIHLGRFTSELEAAKAYNLAAVWHFGPFAHLNPLQSD
jgi:hypothetical protein